MTAGFGFGMFAYNMVCLMIGLIIIYIVIRNIKWQQNQKQFMKVKQNNGMETLKKVFKIA